MERDRDSRSRRYDDGEVVRYGAGESWRPTPRGERSPRRGRSPVRPRSPPRVRSPRHRSPIVAGSDSYVPLRYQPRRRSRSGGDRYRRERSRDRESPRRRERTRSPIRRSPPIRRRDSPARENRYDRPRSPRREWDRDRDRDWDRERNRIRDREREPDRREERSRSPFMRERRRERTPPGRMSPIPVRGGSFRPRSRSPSRRGDRYQSFRRSPPPKELVIPPAAASQPTSEKGPSRPQSVTAPSPLRDQSPRYVNNATSLSSKETARPGSYESPPLTTKSPPRGPAALRAPPTGPSANRANSVSNTTPVHMMQRHNQTQSNALHRQESSPPNPPSGPRGYVPSARGSSFGSRVARGSWSQTPSRHASGPLAVSTMPITSNIPTGPRVPPANTLSSGATNMARLFNPPTGPSAQHGSGPRQSLAQNLLGTMPLVIPGGKLDPSMTPLLLGVTKEIEPHYKKLRDEEEKLREELRLKQERLRKGLYTWNRLERDARAWEMRSDLSEKSMKNLAGEGIGGAAF